MVRIPIRGFLLEPAAKSSCILEGGTKIRVFYAYKIKDTP